MVMSGSFCLLKDGSKEFDSESQTSIMQRRNASFRAKTSRKAGSKGSSCYSYDGILDWVWGF